MKRFGLALTSTLSRSGLAACLAGTLALSSGSVSAQTQFVRGDASGNGILALDDVVQMMNYFFLAGPQPSNGCGDPFSFDLVDVNDNEYLTVADPILLANALFLGGTVPPPLSCGFDPGNQTNGFDSIDPAYEVTLAGPYDLTDPQNPLLRRVGFDVALSAPGNIRAVELYFDYDPAELSNPQYDGVLPLGVTSPAFGVARMTITDPLNPLSVSSGFHRLGRIVFDVTPGTLLPDIQWISSFTDTFLRRATVVDDNLNDHHPAFVRVDAPVFIRGDLNGDGVYDVNDLIMWVFSFSNGSLDMVSSVCNQGETEGLDVNDNEYVTIADYLRLAGELFCAPGVGIPNPIFCGVDPNNDTAGFDEVDPDYAIRATNFTLIGAGPIERDVEIPIRILTPEPVRAITFILDLGTPDLSLDNPFFETSASLPGLLTSANRQVGQFVIVTLATDCNPIVPTGDSLWQDLGTLKLHLLGTELPQPIQWVPELDVDGFLYRTTVVTSDFADHHPLLLAGENQFRRGDANNQGPVGLPPVDIGDPIFLLNYLSGTGPFPQCLDAADSNNDGKIDIGDAIYSLNYLVGQLPPFPTPFDCGYELDIDELDCQFSTCPQ